MQNTNLKEIKLSNMQNMQNNMQNNDDIHLTWICKIICKNMQNMQNDMQKFQNNMEFSIFTTICKLCKKICKICKIWESKSHLQLENMHCPGPPWHCWLGLGCSIRVITVTGGWPFIVETGTDWISPGDWPWRTARVRMTSESSLTVSVHSTWSNYSKLELGGMQGLPGVGALPAPCAAAALVAAPTRGKTA